MSFLEQLLKGVAAGNAQRATAFEVVRKDRAAAAAAEEAVEAPQQRFHGWRKRKREWKGRVSATVEQVLEAWHATRRDECGITTIDDGHACTVAGCIHTDSIQCISDDLRLYGCITSGLHHVCHTDRGCYQRYTTADGGIFCIFSRRFIETYIDTTRYGQKMRETEMHLRAPVSYVVTEARAERKCRRDTVRAERRAAREAAGPAGVAAGAPTRMRFGMSIPEKQRDMLTVAEAKVASARALAGDCGGDDSRVDGFIAIDGTDEVDNTVVATRARPMLTDGSSPSVAPAPWSTAVTTAHGSRALVLRDVGARARMRRPPKEYFSRYTRADIGHIAGALFDKKHRTTLHKRRTVMAAEAALSAISRYYVACADAHVRPCAQERDALYETAVQRVPQVTAVDLDGTRRTRYVAFLYELWRVVIATPYFRAKRNAFRLASHTLGALYMLREPFAIASPDGTVAATVVEEPDAFLVEHLPPPALLRRWDARVTVHSASRVVAIKGAAGGHIEFSMTCISNGRNAIKAALLSIETDAERVAVAARLRTAYETGAFENDSEIYYRCD